MAKLALIFVAAITLQSVLAAPKVDKAPPAENTAAAADIFLNFLKDVTAEIQKVIPDPKQAVENVQKTSNEVVSGLKGVVSKFKTDVEQHKGEFSAAADGVITKVKASINNLQKLTTPPEGSRAADIKAKLDNNLKDLTEYGNKLKDDLKPHFEQVEKQLSDLGKFITDGFYSFGKTVQDHVENVVKHD